MSHLEGTIFLSLKVPLTYTFAMICNGYACCSVTKLPDSAKKQIGKCSIDAFGGVSLSRGWAQIAIIECQFSEVGTDRSW